MRLDALGVPVELVAWPRTGHNPLQWRWRTGLAVVYRWLVERTSLDSIAASALEGEADARIGLRGDDRAGRDGAEDDHPHGDPQPR